MDASSDQLLGLLVLAVGALGIGGVALRRQPRAIKLFAAALCLVGLGYLATTSAPSEIATAIFGGSG